MMVMLSVDAGDGDPIEADVELPIVPRVGDEIEFWDASWSTSVFVTVQHVVLCAYASEKVVVAIRFDGYDLELVRRVMAGAQRGDTP